MIENHVTSLSLSKQLKEAGCPQISEFYHILVWGRWFVDRVKNPSDYDNDNICSAYLSSELGELLPHIIKAPYGDEYREQIVNVYKRKDDWLASAGLFYEELAKNECEAKAEMLLHLIKQGLVKFKEGV